MTSPRLALAAAALSIPETLARASDYSDYIAHRISRDLGSRDPAAIIAHVGKVRHDLHSTGGYLQSSTKRVEMIDRNGNRYIVTVERV